MQQLLTTKKLSSNIISLFSSAYKSNEEFDGNKQLWYPQVPQLLQCTNTNMAKFHLITSVTIL